MKKKNETLNEIEQIKNLSVKELSVADQKKFKSNRNVPESFIRPLKPIGLGRFMGDKMPVGWSVNDKFEIGEVYPIYAMEGVFVVGNDGDSYKIVPTAWKISYL